METNNRSGGFRDILLANWSSQDDAAGARLKNKTGCVLHFAIRQKHQRPFEEDEELTGGSHLLL